MRLAVSLFCLSSLVVVRGEDPPDKPVEQIAKEVRPSLVTISHPSRDQSNHREGCGFVVGEGLIATNYHVIGDGRAINVSTTDAKALTVESVHASDRRLDLALLRVKEKDLPALPLGVSAGLPDGLSVVAVGNPQGLRQSVVQGVISAVRTFEGVQMIQLAIPIEPGNSGGPLLDRQGRVIGIPTMKSAQTENIGFAMPVDSLKLLLERPNPVPIARWMTVGQLNGRKWKPIQEGAHWRQRAGHIHVEGMSEGFGGRSICLYQQPPPVVPYEVAVTVKLDDESGAAGLVFASDGGDKHYGFYPSNGKLRLTHFDGPTVFQWNILADVPVNDYRPGDWNRLLVRVDKDKITAFVNGQRVVESPDVSLREGLVGLVKFRQTKADFRDFTLGKDAAKWHLAPASQDVAKLREEIERLAQEKSAAAPPEGLATDLALSQDLLEAKAKDLDAAAKRLRDVSGKLHQQDVEREMAKLLRDKEDGQIDLFHAALLIAKLADRGVDVEARRAELGAMADELRGRFAEDATAEQKLEALIEYLFRDQGFHGSRIDYYTPENSYLSSVLDDREGIPITLSVLFMELAHRVGLPEVRGIALPGHFLAQYDAEDPAKRQWIDVYEGGRKLLDEDLHGLAQRTSGLPVGPEDLQPASKKSILTRMLRNLIKVHLDSDEARKALPFLHLLLLISPDEPAERLSRAILSFQTGDLVTAKQDVEWVLRHRPPNVNLERIELLKQQIESREGK